MKIAILGCGAVGSLYATCIAQSSAADVLCIVRSAEHAARINSSGITIKTVNGQIYAAAHPRAVTNTSGEQPADLVLISVKSYSTEEAISRHTALFGPYTIAITLQNGYGNHKHILKAVPPERIIMGTTSMGVYIDKERRIILAGTGKTVIGPFAQASPAGQAALRTVSSVLKAAGFDTDETDDPQNAILHKLMINVGINAICALADKENSFICSDQTMRLRSERLVREAVGVINLAFKRNYDPDAMWQSVLSTAEKTGKNVCSMLQDVRNGRLTEIAAINGAIADIARSAGISAPENTSITSDILSLCAERTTN